MSRGFVVHPAILSKAIVETGPHDISLEFCVGASDGAAAAEIDVEIFDLGAPRTIEGVFEAAADGPAGLGVAGAADAADVVLDVADGKTAGHVRHEAVNCVAKPAAHGAEPGILGFAGQAATGAAAFDPTGVDVAFDAEHDL